MKLLVAVLTLALCGVAQEPSRKPPVNPELITAERISAACAKVRKYYRPCYPTAAVPKPQACSSEMTLMQNMLPVMEDFAEQVRRGTKSVLWNHTGELARDFVEAVEAIK